LPANFHSFCLEPKNLSYQLGHFATLLHIYPDWNNVVDWKTVLQTAITPILLCLSNLVNSGQ